MKTREKLIEVARNLFLYKGLENTTMNDIATASEKGRRTVYTYFKNKKEIYQAVLTRESDTLVAELEKIADNPALTTPERLRQFLLMRLRQLDTRSAIHESLATSFFKMLKPDFRRVIRIRQLAWDKSQQILQRILDQGVREGCLDARQAERIVHFASETLVGIAYVKSFGIADETSEPDGPLCANHFIDYILSTLELE